VYCGWRARRARVSGLGWPSKGGIALFRRGCNWTRDIFHRRLARQIASRFARLAHDRTQPRLAAAQAGREP